MQSSHESLGTSVACRLPQLIVAQFRVWHHRCQYQGWRIVSHAREGGFEYVTGQAGSRQRRSNHTKPPAHSPRCCTTRASNHSTCWSPTSGCLGGADFWRWRIYAEARSCRRLSSSLLSAAMTFTSGRCGLAGQAIRLGRADRAWPASGRSTRHLKACSPARAQEPATAWAVDQPAPWGLRPY